MDLTHEQLERLRIRSHIRARNHLRPRCSGCGCDMPVFTERDIVTEEHMSKPGYEYIPLGDYRPGDLVCIWCIYDEIGQPEQPYIWGHA
jgi:hypothetical protein